MKFGVIIFPGSNCDHDAYWTIQNVAHQPVTFLWHESHDLEDCDAIVTPVESADEAVKLLQGGQFDVHVSDFGMPSENGYSFIKRVRLLAQQAVAIFPPSR